MSTSGRGTRIDRLTPTHKIAPFLFRTCCSLVQKLLDSKNFQLSANFGQTNAILVEYIQSGWFSHESEEHAAIPSLFLWAIFQKFVCTFWFHSSVSGPQFTLDSERKTSEERMKARKQQRKIQSSAKPAQYGYNLSGRLASAWRGLVTFWISRASVFLTCEGLWLSGFEGFWLSRETSDFQSWGLLTFWFSRASDFRGKWSGQFTQKRSDSESKRPTESEAKRPTASEAKRPTLTFEGLPAMQMWGLAIVLFAMF